MVTVGVEEEYLLLHADTGMPAPLARAVRQAAGLDSIASVQEVQSELLQAQIEVATPVCDGLSEVGGHLLRLRHAMALAAEANGCRLAMTGTAAIRDTGPVPVTPTARYVGMRSYAPQLVQEQLINGMHVHLGVPDREAGVEVLNRIRGWLPALVALSANSPMWDGHDTGFASWRTIVFGRWPLTGPTPVFDGVRDYERRVERLLESGIVADAGQIYWQARLSEKYPTVEVRCPDVQLRADEAVLLAAIARALVATALREAQEGCAYTAGPVELVQAATWQAARHGLNGPLIGPDARRCTARDMIATLMRHIAPALDDHGDRRDVTSLLHRLLQDGTGADQQRQALTTGGLAAVIDLTTTVLPLVAWSRDPIRS
ncbi:carboxylate-amine ligase [Streptomyces sp. IBSNAI002]|uniref:carboxylate-amine ligase n=1 Tax=Streptomyces sp. IBSNAI002 TaxID=3457500 RepID=UPI003FD6884F